MTGERSHLQGERSFLNGRIAKWGDKGSSRPDIYNSTTGDVYDYKFTTNQPAQLSNPQRTKNIQNIPNIGKQTPIYPK